MPDFTKMTFEQLLNPDGFDCACGQRHACGLRIFESGASVVEKVPEVLKKLGAKRPFLVCDENTHRAAGARVAHLLDAAGIPYDLFQFLPGHVEPDEFAVGDLTMHFNPACDLLLAVGSGVINDVCKVAARAFGLRSMVVATAPSMDGYASNSSSMHVRGVKSTLYNACPVAIVADCDIIAAAPMRMLWAGLGDMIAKYVSICEWRIANLVIDEPYCEDVAALVRHSLAQIVENAPGLKDRDKKAVQAVTEGLVLSGVAMAFAASSRPASGLEHYFSHMWEMMAAERGGKADLHGIQVGVGTLETLALYDWIKTIAPDPKRATDFMDRFDGAEWERMVKRIFGGTAPQILAIEERVHKNDPAKRARRFERIEKNWDAIQRIIAEELPDTQSIAELMRCVGMPMTPADLGISREDTRDAFTGAREIRDKYLSCSMLWDMGLTEEARARF